MKYLDQALFIYDELSTDVIETLKANEYGTDIIAVEKSKFLGDPLEYLSIANHLILCGDMTLIYQLLEFAYAHSANGQLCTLAFLPLSDQKLLRNSYQLSSKLQDNIEVALRDDTKPINLLECNGKIVQFKAVIGRIPLLKSWHSDASMKAFFQNIFLGIQQFFSLSLDKLTIRTEKDKEIKTVASGLFIVNQNKGSHLSRVLQRTNSMRSNNLSLIILSPFSAVEYFLFLFSMVFHIKKENALPHAVSNIKSKQVTLEMEISFDETEEKMPDVILDENNHATFPLTFNVIKHAVKINAPEDFWTLNPVSNTEKEVIRIDNLPDENERVKYFKARLPFFSVASEERFKDLFLQLRTDANINSLYIVLMLLSTLLASFGLFANSAAIVIGAMLLAPLMSPIISFSMGLLRGDDQLLTSSLMKIALGVSLAVFASSLLTLLLPLVDLSNEIKSRIHPNLIDMGVAVISGIAAAYTKAHKELLNSIAGVAIAVALVPPLAVAGIGIGRGELYIFEGAFLLFVTNLIGITLSTVLTFQFLGFSNTVKSKKSLGFIFIILIILSYPLYRSYADSLQSFELTNSLQSEEFIIHKKKIMIENATIGYQNNMKIINIIIVLKQALNEQELQILKNKIDQRFVSEYQIRITKKFIL
ncbi:MAG: TIGR00341 family protein [Gammaproteobacteria bacterium]|nr:TIGR00341 family protein [Gammaproteobacteria bacterium]